MLTLRKETCHRARRKFQRSRNNKYPPHEPTQSLWCANISGQLTWEAQADNPGCGPAEPGNGHSSKA